MTRTKNRGGIGSEGVVVARADVYGEVLTEECDGDGRTQKMEKMEEERTEVENGNSDTVFWVVW